MRKAVILIMVFVCLLLLVSCNKCESNASPFFQAEIVLIYEDIMLVTPLEGFTEAELYASTGIGITIHDFPNVNELKVGDIVEITYSGQITNQEVPSAIDVEKIVVIRPAL